MNPKFHVVDVQIPTAIVDEVMEASTHAVLVDRKGAGPGSLTNDGLRYEVVSGGHVNRLAPQLSAWIHRTIPEVVRIATGETWKISTDDAAWANINVLRGRGERYELHYDPNPLTVVVYFTNHAQGGEFEYEMNGLRELLPVKRGRVVIMEGCKIPHGVRPMLDDNPRVSVPIELFQGETMPEMAYSHREAALYEGAE